MIQYLHRLRGRKGFTMIELIVVIAIAAVLMTVILVGSLGGNTEDVIAANSNAQAFFTASQLALTRAQLTERSLVDYDSTDTKFIEYKNGANSTNGKYLFIEAKFNQNGIAGIHIENYLNKLMAKPDAFDDTSTSKLEKYLATNLNEYMADSFEGYFYCMADDNFKVLFTHYCKDRLPMYDVSGSSTVISISGGSWSVGSPSSSGESGSSFRDKYMIASGTKVKDCRNVLGSCSDAYMIPDVGQYAFNLPEPSSTDFAKYFA